MKASDVEGGTKSSSNMSSGFSAVGVTASVAAVSNCKDVIDGLLLSSDLSAAAGASSIESVSALFSRDDMSNGLFASNRLSRMIATATAGTVLFKAASMESNSNSKLDPEPVKQVVV